MTNKKFKFNFLLRYISIFLLPSFVYAESGNEGFDMALYSTFTGYGFLVVLLFFFIWFFYIVNRPQEPEAERIQKQTTGTLKAIDGRMYKLLNTAYYTIIILIAVYALSLITILL